MDTDRLRYFCTVARTGNLHRASELLGVSVAALSKSIKALESEIGLQLLVPSGRGIVISDGGKKFAARTAILLEQFEQLIRSTSSEDLPLSILRLGSFEVFTTHSINPLLMELLPEHQLVLHELTPGKLEEALAKNEIDFGITYIPIPHPDLDFLKVTQLEMGVFVRKDRFQKHPLEQIPFAVPVIPIQGSPTKVAGLDGWPDGKVPRLIHYRVTMMESALELARMGLCAVFIPKFIARLHNEKVREKLALREIPSPKKLPSGTMKQSVYLVKRKGEAEGKTAKRLAKGIRLLCKMNPPQ